MGLYAIRVDRAETCHFIVEADSAEAAKCIFGEYEREGDMHEQLDASCIVETTCHEPRLIKDADPSRMEVWKRDGDAVDVALNADAIEEMEG